MDGESLSASVQSPPVKNPLLDHDDDAPVLMSSDFLIISPALPSIPLLNRMTPSLASNP